MGRGELAQGRLCTSFALRLIVAEEVSFNLVPVNARELERMKICGGRPLPPAELMWGADVAHLKQFGLR